MTCHRARELIPLYAARALAESAGAELIAHVVGCASCQTELVATLRVGHELRKAFAAIPRLPEGTWLAVAARTVGIPLLRVQFGTEIAGFALGLRATESGVPLTGTLSVLGREAPVVRFP